MRKAILTEGPIGRIFFRMTLPMVGGIYAMIAIFLVDTYFISRLGTEALAAVSFTFPITMILIYFVMGVGVGAASVISRAIGEEDHQRVKRLATSAMALTVIMATAISVIGLLTMKQLFTFLGAEPEVLVLIVQYMGIWYIGIVFEIIPMVGNNIIRATGDAKTPALIMMSSAIINLILDPLLIFGLFGFPQMGIKGAALATLIAFLISTIGSLYIISKREHLVCGVSIKELFNSWKDIIHIGIPSAVSNVMIHLAFAVVVKLLASYGKEAVAGFGIATRVEILAFGVYFALSSIIGPFMGQNWGAGKLERVKEGLRLSNRFCIISGLVLALILAFFARPIAVLFDSNQTVVAVAVLYLLVVPVSYGGEGIIMMTTSTYNALGHPYPAAAITLTRMFILYIPLAYLGKIYFGVCGIFAAPLIANVIAGWISFKLQGAHALQIRRA